MNPTTATPVLTLGLPPASAEGACGSFVSLDIELTLSFDTGFDGFSGAAAAARRRDHGMVAEESREGVVSTVAALPRSRREDAARPGGGPGSMSWSARRRQRRGGRSTRRPTPSGGTDLEEEMVPVERGAAGAMRRLAAVTPGSTAVAAREGPR